jgi:orotidine-5'-phosphate decarboxylase
MTPKVKLAVAFDYSDINKAVELGKLLKGQVEIAKVGLELFSAIGPLAIAQFRELGYQVFVDLKLYDIPNTVMMAARNLAKIGADYLTVHLKGESQMVKSAINGAKEVNANCKVLGVTILTSEKKRDPDQLKHLIAIAKKSCCDGIVCSAAELLNFKEELADLLKVVPGIRIEGEKTHDQKAVCDPKTAVARGADILVIGRSVTQSSDPAKIIEFIRDQISIPYLG